MKTWLLGLFADANGIPDDARISAFAMVCAFIALSTWNVLFEHRPFDPVQYGTGAGLLAAGIGALFGIRKGN